MHQYIDSQIALVHISLIAVIHQGLLRPHRPPLFTQPDVTTSTHPGHYLGRDKLSRRPRSLWIAAGLPSWEDAKPCEPPDA